MNRAHVRESFAPGIEPSFCTVVPDDPNGTVVDDHRECVKAIVLDWLGLHFGWLPLPFARQRLMLGLIFQQRYRPWPPSPTVFTLFAGLMIMHDMPPFKPPLC